MTRLAPISDRLKSVGGVFVAIVILQFVLAAASFEILSSVRAYVAGESLYSKGQKDALLGLQAYLQSRSEADYQQFLQALVVPEGDASARRALQQAHPDWAAAREGFVAGLNDRDDVDGMIRLFVLAHDVPFMARAIRIWEEGDAAIVELKALVQDARRHLLAGDNQAAAVRTLAERAPELNQRLTRLEREFSDQLGQASHIVQRSLLGLNLLIATLLATMGSRYIRRSLRAQRQREAEISGLLQAVTEAVLTVDREHRVVMFNRAAESLFGVSAAAALAAPVDRFILSGLPALADVLPPGASEAVHELSGLHADGRPLHLEASLAQLKTARGLRTTIVCRDVTGQRAQRERERSQLVRHNMELARKAYTDALTGLPNREALEQHLDDKLAEAQRSGAPLSVLFLDLDGFKAVNDTLGHLAGDELLRMASVRLRDAVRRQDEVFRVSGDEFVVVVADDVGPATAQSLAERVLAAVREPYRLGEADTRVTVSVGVANHPHDGTDARSLLLAADAAMYRAKQRGKNGYQIGAAVAGAGHGLENASPAPPA